MRILRHISGVPPLLRGAVVALGNFDGLHLGHQGVIREAQRIARQRGAPWGVLTFEPHPRQFFQPSTVPFRITPFRTKARLLAELGLDVMFNLRFDARMAARLAQEFVIDVLVDGLGVQHVVTGPSFVFGKGRRGNAYVLARMADMEGFGFTPVPAVTVGGAPCSATDVRVLLRRGLVDEAAVRLGRAWEFEGRVIAGARRGRQLGYPTANLAVEGRLHPSQGIYAVKVRVEDDSGPDWRDAVVSLGTRPTFGGEAVLLEVHLFDFAGDLYRRRLRVAFVRRIRKELRFANAEELKARMAQDCLEARRILAGTGASGEAGAVRAR